MLQIVETPGVFYVKITILLLYQEIINLVITVKIKEYYKLEVLLGEEE